MILSGNEILSHIGKRIVIEPFDAHNINPNSYNLHLHNELMVYEEIVLDMRRSNRHRRLVIPPEGLVLEPNRLYLGRTIEYTETHGFVPMIEGRSSVGRLGMCVHVTAGFGDVGFCGYWTLEIFALHPIRIYPSVAVCQVYYHTISENHVPYERGKYQNNKDIQPSLLYTELSPDNEGRSLPLFEQA